MVKRCPGNSVFSTQYSAPKGRPLELARVGIESGVAGTSPIPSLARVDFARHIPSLASTLSFLFGFF